MAFLACDWGTTNLRAWVLEADGRVLAEREFPAFGVSRLLPGEAAQRFRHEVRSGLQAEQLPAVLCGMIGSTLGWVVAPYVDTPVDLKALARKLVRVDEPGPPVFIVPGVKGPGFGRAPEVMRGEETQVLGWLAGDPDRRQGLRLVVHPGTHAKWVLVENGRIVRFLSAMTGELYDVIRKHSVLRAEVTAMDEGAFAEGLEAAGDGDALATRLFSARTRVVAGDRRPESTGAYLSGLLIGAEVAATPRLLGVERDIPICLVGEPALCRWYETALKARGRRVTVHDGDQASLAGLVALQQEAANAQ
jgi:2-dehydro-3-deoxygalactonokinase